MIRTLPTARPLNGGLRPVAVRGLQDAPFSFVQGGRAPCFAKGGTKTGASGSVAATQATRGSGVLTLPDAGTIAQVPEARHEPGSTSAAQVTSVPQTSSEWGHPKNKQASQLLYQFWQALDPLGMASFKFRGRPINDWADFGHYFLRGGIEIGGKSISVCDEATFRTAATVLLGQTLQGLSFGTESAQEIIEAIIQVVQSPSLGFQQGEDVLIETLKAHVQRIQNHLDSERGQGYGQWLYKKVAGYVSSNLNTNATEFEKVYVIATIMTFWAREKIANRDQIQEFKQQAEAFQWQEVGRSYAFRRFLPFLAYAASEKASDAWFPTASVQQQLAVELLKIALDLLAPQLFVLDSETKRSVIDDFTTVLQTNATNEEAVLRHLRGFFVSNFSYITSDEQKWEGLANGLLGCSKFGDGNILASTKSFRLECQNFIINNLEAMTLQNFPLLKNDVGRFIEDKYSRIKQHLQGVYPMVLAIMAHPSFRQDPVESIESMVARRGSSEKFRMPMDIVLGFFVANSKKFEPLKRPGSIPDVTIEPVSAPWSDDQKAKAVTLLYRVLVALDPLGMAEQFEVHWEQPRHLQNFAGFFLRGGVKTGQGKSEQPVKVVDSASFGDAANVLLGQALEKYSFGPEWVSKFKEAITRYLDESPSQRTVDFRVLWENYVAVLIDWFNTNRSYGYGDWLYGETYKYVSLPILVSSGDYRAGATEIEKSDFDKAYMTALFMTLWAKAGIKKRQDVQKFMRDLLKLLPEGGVKPFPYEELLSFLEDVSLTPIQGGEWKRFAPPKGH